MIESTPLPRIFALFLNKEKNKIFEDSVVVDAVKQGIQKISIVEKVLYGFGEELNSPIPRGYLDQATNTLYQDTVKISENLEKAGWKTSIDGIREKTDTKNKTSQTLKFSIATADTPELMQVVDEIKHILVEHKENDL